MKERNSLLKNTIMLIGFYFRIWLYTIAGIMLTKWIINNQQEPYISADFWNSFYPASKFLLVILLLILSGDLIRFYRNLRRQPAITAPRHRFYLTVAALAGGAAIFLLTISYCYPFSV